MLRRGLAPDAAERRLGEDLAQEAARLDREPGPASLLTRIVLDVKRISAERERGKDQDQEIELEAEWFRQLLPKFAWPTHARCRGGLGYPYMKAWHLIIGPRRA